MEDYPKRLIEAICTLAKEMGWAISLPEVGDDDDLPGLIVGSEAYVDGILKHVPKDFSDQFKKEP